MSKNPSRKADLWAHRIENWKASGLSRKKWCEQNSLSPSSLQYWLARQSNKETATSQFIEIEDQARDNCSKGLQVLIGTATIEVGIDFDERTLQRLVKVLGGAL